MIMEDNPVATAPGSVFVLRRQVSLVLRYRVSNYSLPVGEGNEGKGVMACHALSPALSQREREMILCVASPNGEGDEVVLLKWTALGWRAKRAYPRLLSVTATRLLCSQRGDPPRYRRRY
jgi:hypothetical protein